MHVMTREQAQAMAMEESVVAPGSLRVGAAGAPGAAGGASVSVRRKGRRVVRGEARGGMSGAAVPDVPRAHGAASAQPIDASAGRDASTLPPGIPPGASLAYNASAAHGYAPAWDEAHAEGAGAPRVSARVVSGKRAAGAVHNKEAAAAQVAATGIATRTATATDSVAINNAAARAALTVGPAALARAIALRGGQSALASAIGVSQSHVWNWLQRRRVPAEHCPAIERATRRAVRCEELRPDIDWAYLRAVCEEIAATPGETASAVTLAVVSRPVGEETCAGAACAETACDASSPACAARTPQRG